MLAGSASTAASTISTDRSPVISPPAARPPRRRGLSYLRNYTFGLEHSRPDSPAPPPVSAQNPRTTTTSDQVVPPTPARSTIENSEGWQLVDTDQSMSRNRQLLGLDGAGISSTIEYASRVTPLPAVPSSGPDPDGNLHAVPPSARTEGANTSLGPSIQFIPAIDTSRPQRPSLNFNRITRVLPHPNSVIKVGRYSERDTTQEMTSSDPSDAPIGFKSKVVSRKHCEFFFQNGQWYLKDVKSSSGTFLNHIRLSQPGIESKPFPVNDGDVVQLGIDFKGGEEMIFRCVKIRVETNRSWQRGLNKFNKSTHRQLQRLASGKKEVDSDTVSKHSTECTICLNTIAPCQALFVAPCSHTWHYKCIRSMLESTRYPNFLCPNCRAQADLDADVEEEDLEDFDEFDETEIGRVDADKDRTHSPTRRGPGPEAPTSSGQAAGQRGRLAVSPSSEQEPDTPFNTDDLAWTLGSMMLRPNEDQLASLDDTIAGFSAVANPRARLQPGRVPSEEELRQGGGSTLNPSASAFIPSPTSDPISVPSSIPGGNFGSLPARHLARRRTDTLDGTDMLDINDANSDDIRAMSAERIHREGPMTPRNAAGPFVFDGAGRTGSSPQRSAERERRQRETTIVGTDTDGQSR